MAVSALRTIVVGSPGSSYGVCSIQPMLRWPMAGPDEVLDYSLDFTTLLNDVGDSIFSVTASAAPSGAGELELRDLSVNGNTVTLDLAGGVPGRRYQIAVDVFTAAGRVFTVSAGLLIDPMSGEFPLPTPPSTGFGTAITWSAGGTMFGNGLIIATNLTAVGGSQVSALPLPAVTNIFGTVAPGTGGILSASIPVAIYRVVNADAEGDDLLIYPPVGASIGTAAPNSPVIVSAGQSVDFMTQAASSQWYAA